MDAFKPMQEYFHIVVMFLRLEKIEYGGVKGQILSDLVQDIFTEFTDLVNTFQSQQNDPLDISNNVS